MLLFFGFFKLFQYAARPTAGFRALASSFVVHHRTGIDSRTVGVAISNTPSNCCIDPVLSGVRIFRIKASALMLLPAYGVGDNIVRNVQEKELSTHSKTNFSRLMTLITSNVNKNA